MKNAYPVKASYFFTFVRFFGGFFFRTSNLKAVRA